MINFIGIGAQKAGTSWIYACLYEHPEICAPVKEIHFFSRDRFTKGREWYEAHFSACGEEARKGEFSTSYLYSSKAPNNIKSLYPSAKLIAVLRHPVERAYSQYYNAIKAGEIKHTVSFIDYCDNNESVIEQGKYAAQLSRYYAAFPKSQLLVMLYEDIERDPQAFMCRVYEFLEIDSTFVPSMINRRINTARIPKLVFVDRHMHKLAEWMRKNGLDRVVHIIRKSGLPDFVRLYNTSAAPVVSKEASVSADISHVFKKDVEELSVIIGKDMNQYWNI